MCSAPFRHDGATGPVIFNVFTTPSPTAAAIFASTCAWMIRSCVAHAVDSADTLEHPVAQCGRGRVLGDVFTDDRRPLAEHRALGHPRRPAALLRHVAGGAARAAADRGRPGPGRTSGAGFRPRRRGGSVAADGPRPTSLPWVRAAPRASSSARRTRSIPGSPLNRSGGPAGRLVASPSFLYRRHRSAVAVMQCDGHSRGIPIAGNVVEDRRRHQHLLCRSRGRGQCLPAGRVEFGEHVIE